MTISSDLINQLIPEEQCYYCKRELKKFDEIAWNKAQENPDPLINAQIEINKKEILKLEQKKIDLSDLDKYSESLNKLKKDDNITMKSLLNNNMEIINEMKQDLESHIPEMKDFFLFYDLWYRKYSDKKNEEPKHVKMIDVVNYFINGDVFKINRRVDERLNNLYSDLMRITQPEVVLHATKNVEWKGVKFQVRICPICAESFSSASNAAYSLCEASQGY